MKITTFYISLFLVLATSTYSQKINQPKLDSLFAALEQNNKAMGSLTIVKNDEVLYARSIGYRFISDKEKIATSAQTKYRVGSISKMVTATMIFQLIDEGKLTLETTLHKYLPDMPNAKLITIGNMLNHRSGLHNFTSRADYEAWSLIPKTQKEMLGIIAQGGADFMPDAKTEYSNSNYYVLGYLIEKITKQSYAKNLKERISSKIGLLNTEVGTKTDVQKNESYSYEFTSNKWILKIETDITITGGAGCVISTTSDLCQFIEALFHLQLVLKNSLDKMQTAIDGCGMGMFPLVLENKKCWGHSGKLDGFSSVLVYFPEDSVAIACCSNADMTSKNYMFNGALRIFYGLDYIVPDFKLVNVSKEILKSYVGVYSAKSFPLKIAITTDSTILFAQATGQPSFPLETVTEYQFKYDPANVKIHFNGEKKELVLSQNGGVYLFKKEE
ncbi:MAG: penicillin-binding protein beta-lactamase class [Chitinophagaceae bacterium]|nr:penicillin-binding protein beta-lactamase class [Chitinophagaceae bacterium]